MPTQLTAYRVFIASPSGLDDVRDAFRKIIQEYNEDEANSRGVSFIPVGWELTTPGKGRPQERINADIRECDFFVLVLHVRWGSPTSAPTASGFSSGCEEEWAVANGVFGEKPRSMLEVVAFFRAAPTPQMADPGEQLRRVLEFRKRLEVEKTHHYQSFDVVSEFERYLRRLLGRWLFDHEKGGGAPKVGGGPLVPLAPVSGEPSIEAASAPTGKAVDANPADQMAIEAEGLADAGKLVEAEELFAKATAGGSDLSAMLRFAKFLDRVGQLERAKEKLSLIQPQAERAGDHRSLAIALRRMGNIELTLGNLRRAEEFQRRSLATSENANLEDDIASAFGNLGNIESTRGNLDAAEAYHKKSLAINEKLGRPEGMASDYGNLGIIEIMRGNLDAAEVYFRKSLAIHGKLGMQEGMAKDYANLGNIESARGNLDAAEVNYRKSLAIHGKLGMQEGMAKNYANLGLIEQTRGNLDAAEVYHRKALAIDEKLGRPEGMAADYGNLGLIEQTRGNLDAAEEYHKKSIAIEEKLGRPEGMASDYGNLGNIELTRGNLDAAEEYHKKSLAINEELGRQEGIATAYGNLGLIEATRTNVGEARRLWSLSRDLFRKIGAKDREAQAQSLLDSLPPEPPGGPSPEKK
ncbi:MAG: tetratricopeptide repeat protein [Phycisphaerales bacterium]|jgi:tetratricopeptide (TPR) repeat protein|nr:tetratricopeptide repeat protein [Phycisphaerales bacterium]